jgi:hypothetical protein
LPLRDRSDLDLDLVSDLNTRTGVFNVLFSLYFHIPSQRAVVVIIVIIVTIIAIVACWRARKHRGAACTLIHAFALQHDAHLLRRVHGKQNALVLRAAVHVEHAAAGLQPRREFVETVHRVVPRRKHVGLWVWQRLVSERGLEHADDEDVWYRCFRIHHGTAQDRNSPPRNAARHDDTIATFP